MAVKKQPHHKRRSGFTLLEMMITVLIIISSLAIAAPAIQSALANRRSQKTASDILKFGQDARADAMAYGRAHLIRYRPGSTGKGILEIYRGFNGHCNTNNWTTITAGPACGLANSMCRSALNMDSPSNKTRITATGYTSLDICFTSTGQMMWRTVATALFTTDNVPTNNGFVFAVARYDGESLPVGSSREILFPLGGAPRVRR